MKIIGLTGGSGSGKGAVCHILEEFNIPCIDTDRIYRDMTVTASECTKALVAEFGDGILNSSGGIDRTSLASIVFCGEGAEERRSRLNEITHAFILSKTRQILNTLSASGTKIAFVDAPVLFESGFDKECDVTVSVVANREIRLNRIIARDGITLEQAKNRINSQKSDDELTKLTDLSIENNGDLSELREEVLALLEKLK